MAATELERRLIQMEQTFSERITRLEEQVAELTQQACVTSAVPGSAWWKQIIGVFKDDPEFEEAMRLGHEYRVSLRPEAAAEGAT